MDAPPADFPYVFNEAKGQRHIDFMQKFCRQSKGKAGRQLIKFELFQLAKMQLIFGWVEKDTGHRRFREVLDLRGRKCGKSTETAAVLHDMLLNDGENGPEIYCAANSRDQADQVFSEAANMMTQSPALRSFERKRQTDIYCQMNFGKIKKLAAKTMNTRKKMMFGSQWVDSQLKMSAVTPLPPTSHVMPMMRQIGTV